MPQADQRRTPRRRTKQPWTLRGWLNDGAWKVLGLALAIGLFAGFWLACCLITRGSAAEAHPPKAWREINYEVNTLDRRFAPTVGVGSADGVFDCEDYALTKRERLMAAGVPKSSIRLWSVTTGRGGRHAVLEVGGMILDNLEWRIVTRAEAERYYSDWIEMGSVR